MKLPKAIEILTQHQKGTDMLYLPDFPDAEKLGIEALKRINNPLQYNLINPRVPLPGETKE